MTEKQIIKQLKMLQMIKPDREWATFTKNEILKRHQREKTSLREFLFMPLRKPVLAFAFRGTVAVMIMLIGAVFYLYHLSSQEIKFPDISLLEKTEGIESLMASLTEVQKNLEQIKSSLETIKNSKDKRQALIMSEVIKGTALRGKEMVRGLKEQNYSSGKVLASLSQIEKEFDTLTKDSTAVQRQMIGEVINDLETRSLSATDAQRLVRAKEYYQQGKDNEAMLLLVKIMEKN